MRRLAYAWLSVLWLVTGCVTQGTYDELELEYEGKLKTLEIRDARIDEVETENGDLYAKLHAMESELDRLKDEHARMLEDQADLAASAEEMRRALQELEARKAQVEARLADYRQLLERFKPLMDAGKLRVKIAKGRMVVELASDVLFSSGSAHLGQEGKMTIIEVTGLLASIPKRTFQIEGHTDDIPIRTDRFPSNWELAAARAITVLRTMVEAGMPADRISAASYAESQPALPNDSKENRSANRRIEIVVVPDLSTLPGYDELQKTGSE